MPLPWGEVPITRETALKFAARAAGKEALMCDAPANGRKLKMDFQRKEKNRDYD